ncbi:Ppx/GppA phosphatase family protein [Saccharolobus islandicus]|uniref:Exopolyphosphatase n=1 Tax=Saccharolobus islandicus LAL14/1 TaxID=1241935 RepID=M9U468_SACIS|nr:Ppx/GppA phosphatase family protein [Sulfolobus islandicus]AGJ61824.1 Exopolyphosphatase [Sulfolobus islandicus LAL14/1]
MISAVIDCGYNSFRMVIYQVFRNGTFRMIGSSKSYVRIGEGLKEGDIISEEKVAKAERAFMIFKRILNGVNVNEVKIVATSAFRYASNGNEVRYRLSKIIENEVRVISGEEEGRYAALGILNTLPISEGVFFELGGGSLEIAEVSSGNIIRVHQLPIGALKLVNLPEREIRKKVSDELSTTNIKKANVIVGSGGNVRALAKLDLKLSSFPIKSIHGYSLSSKQISKYASLLPSLDIDSRQSLPGISKERALTIHSASVIIDELVKYFTGSYIVVSLFGMREGVLTEGKSLDKMSWLEEISYSNAIDPPPIEIFKEVISEVDSKYSFYVASSALLSLIFKMVGYFNPFRACYRFIKESVLPGFTLNEALLVGLICEAAGGKVKKKQAKLLKEDITKKEIVSFGNIVKNSIDKYIAGVRL